jgi:hypothetical protein
MTISIVNKMEGVRWRATVALNHSHREFDPLPSSEVGHKTGHATDNVLRVVGRRMLVISTLLC